MSRKVYFVERALQGEYKRLGRGTIAERDLRVVLYKSFQIISENPSAGKQICHSLIPKVYLKKHNIKNLWKYNLPNAWRLLYSVENNRILVVSIILEWMNHKDYERRFNY